VRVTIANAAFIVVTLLVTLVTLAAEARAVAIDWTTVGNPGNAGQLSGAGAGGFGPNAIVGEVDYTYRIGKYDVTNNQYVEFLNAKDPTGANTLGIYNADMSDPRQGGDIKRG
jgi:sulfatase modifying factor 1